MMQAQNLIQYLSREFQLGLLSRAFAEVIRRLGSAPATANIGLHESLPDGTSVHRGVSVADLLTVCDPGQGLSFSREDGADHVYFDLSRKHGTTLVLFVSCSSIEAFEMVRETFEETLVLVRAPPNHPESGESVGAVIDSIFQRLEDLEEGCRAPTRRLRCFLAYRFSSASEIPALRIQTFLALLDVEVLTGVSYEPRKVSDKVLSRLREPLDFIVLLVTADGGESMWTRDEVGTAFSQDIPLIPLIEKGAKFSPGLFGDNEYVEFESDHIGDTFLKLLEAIKFIRQQRRAIHPDGSAPPG